MTNYLETERQMNAVARRSFEAADAAIGSGRHVAQWRAFFVRRRTFLGLVAAFVLVLFADPVPWLLYAGAGLMVAAHLLRLVCAGFLSKDTHLATAGPFAYCRNPLYVGNFMVVVAFALMSGQLIALPIMLLFWVFTHAPTVACEEELLREKFGDEFEEYRRSVPRWFGCRKCATGEGQFKWSRVLQNGEHLNILSAWMVAAMFYIEMVK